MMRVSLLRYPLLASVLLMLALGGWAALQRAGWVLPSLRPSLVGVHGPLMIGGVFGTLIALERAVALSSVLRSPRHWSFLAPAASAAGGMLLLLVGAMPAAQLCLLAGSLLLIAVYVLPATRYGYWSLHTGIMCVGAVLWLVGNAFWLAGQPVYVVVHLWMAFIVLTIVGERLELSRVARLSRRVERLLVAATAVYVGGALLALVNLGAGVRLSGVGAVLLTLWLLRYDIAGKRLRKTGLTRYIALCLITGYVWLGLAGVLSIAFGAVIAGFQYDAILHAIVAGFILSMVFGHALMIFPALTGRQVEFSNAFYLPLVLLHLSVVLREVSDLASAFEGRMWAGMVNAAAVLLFGAVMALGIFRARLLARPTTSEPSVV